VIDAVSIFLVRRWYVVLFLAAYVPLALRHLGARRTLRFSAIAAAISLASEIPSIRWGFPYGLYHYLWEGPTGLDPREPSILGVPCFSTLSYVFLNYAAICLASVLVGARSRAALAVVAGVCMVALDMIIDPIALQGEKWFLGKMYWYPGGGEHFGVPITNYAGWFLVAALIAAATWPLPRARCELGAGLWFGVAAFNIGVTFWIGERTLGWASAGIALPLLATALVRMIAAADEPGGNPA
jgi:uncharacterized membrane protein